MNRNPLLVFFFILGLSLARCIGVSVSYGGKIDDAEIVTGANIPSNEMIAFDFFEQGPPISMSYCVKDTRRWLESNKRLGGFVVESAKCVRYKLSGWWVVTAVRRVKSSRPDREQLIVVYSMKGTAHYPRLPKD